MNWWWSKAPPGRECAEARRRCVGGPLAFLNVGGRALRLWRRGRVRDRLPGVNGVLRGLRWLGADVAVHPEVVGAERRAVAVRLDDLARRAELTAGHVVVPLLRFL